MAEYGSDLDGTPRWRLSVLFMVIVVLSLVGHIGVHSLEEYFRIHKRLGLKHTLESLKDELFALGLITLLLITLQDQIVKMCIDGNSAGDDPYYPTKNRKLLAGSGYKFSCPNGQESFWSITALHEIHILIFLIAVVHLVQAALSMILASLRVRRWKIYEDRECHDMIPLKKKRAIKPEGSWWSLWIWSFFSQFSDSVDGPVYLAIRRFFIEKLELDDDFNFHTFVIDSMEEDFAKLVEFQWVMWLIAAIWILLPWQAYTVIWLSCVFFLVMLVVGAKLQSVAIQLATLAYTHYTPNFIPRKRRKRRSSILVKGATKIRGMLGGHHSSGGGVQMIQQKQSSFDDKFARNGVNETNSTEPKQSLGASLPYKTNPSVEGQADENKSQIAEYMTHKELLSDSSSLFWFGKPKLLLVLFQYVYFVSGLLISLLILDEWRGQQVNHLTGHVVYVLMIGVNLIMMVHAAIFIIPSYAITVAAGAYGPENVLKKALKKHINPKLAKKLDIERKSCYGIDIDDPENEKAAHSARTEHGHGNADIHHEYCGHDDETGRINMLLEAMDHSQARKNRKEGSEQGSSSHFNYH
eukprot:TRINITY_DN13886_c0_g1_i5.p1 TRINITY_DN13886_c0_g1~~TRINITY_DN13886_c0_g1_i5.p1  ORF type:complete len:621 (-),score=56.12 TRINITY_DN13886_c0_g1_i5:142-1884(-)